MTWGLEETVTQRFGSAGVPPENISFRRETYTFRFPFGPTELLAEFRNFYGPTMNAFAAAEGRGREAELQSELEALFVAQNTSTQAGQTTIPANYLRVEVLVP